MTTSVFGNRFAIRSFLPCTTAGKRHRDGNRRAAAGSIRDSGGLALVGHVVTVDLGEVVGMGVRESDHLPADRVAIATVDGVGEVAFDRVLPDLGEEALARHRAGVAFARLERLEQFLARGGRQGREARALEGCLDAADRLAIELRGGQAELVSLALGATLVR